jgi:dipeptidyl aminopeptidase/acylaminoacyl peptidase
MDAAFGRPWRDLWTIDLATGERRKIVSRVPFEGPASPGGRYLLHMQDEQWWTHDLRTGTRTNISKGIATAVVDREDDHPVHHRAPYGVAGWTRNDASVILYDRHDLWEVRPDGSRPTRLTRGAEDSVRYRYLRLDPEERSIDPAKPLYLSATHDWTKASGIARVGIGKAVERLIWQDRSVGRLIKARDADVFAYVAQSWEDSPDYFVAGPTLRDARQVTRTNPSQKDYAWGKSELIEYANSQGERLQGILTYPAGYDPSVKYPMVVYIYEKLSQGLHTYSVPTERSQYSIPAFSQRGYFVLRPDIVFRKRDPGVSIVDCVTSAVNHVAASGLIDPTKVGVMGHSWGGYGSAYLATHTQGVFAAAIAGAPLTNLVSFYGYTSGNSGQPETGHFEVGQERMEVPLWEDPQAYIRNSPLFGMKDATVPLLVEFGDRDGNVDFGQGIEFYNAARRLGKEKFVMVVYNDENHGLAQRKNQVDYHRRQIEWFEHYLKGAPAGKWITEGVEFLEREKEVKRVPPR